MQNHRVLSAVICFRDLKAVLRFVSIAFQRHFATRTTEIKVSLNPTITSYCLPSNSHYMRTYPFAFFFFFFVLVITMCCELSFRNCFAVLQSAELKNNQRYRIRSPVTYYCSALFCPSSRAVKWCSQISWLEWEVSDGFQTSSCGCRQPCKVFFQFSEREPQLFLHKAKNGHHMSSKHAETGAQCSNFGCVAALCLVYGNLEVQIWVPVI